MGVRIPLRREGRQRGSGECHSAESHRGLARICRGPVGACVSFLGRLDSLNRQRVQSALLGCLSPAQTLSLEPPARISQEGHSRHPRARCRGSRDITVPCGPHMRKRRTVYCRQIISRIRAAKVSFFYKNVRSLTQTSQTETTADTTF